jgi:hypothetical protein
MDFIITIIAVMLFAWGAQYLLKQAKKPKNEVLPTIPPISDNTQVSKTVARKGALLELPKIILFVFLLPLFFITVPFLIHDIFINTRPPAEVGVIKCSSSDIVFRKKTENSFGNGQFVKYSLVIKTEKAERVLGMPRIYIHSFGVKRDVGPVSGQGLYFYMNPARFSKVEFDSISSCVDQFFSQFQEYVKAVGQDQWGNENFSYDEEEWTTHPSLQPINGFVYGDFVPQKLTFNCPNGIALIQHATNNGILEREPIIGDRPYMVKQVGEFEGSTKQFFYNSDFFRVVPRNPKEATSTGAEILSFVNSCKNIDGDTLYNVFRGAQ